MLIYSVYMNNVDQRVVEAQGAAVRALMDPEEDRFVQLLVQGPRDDRLHGQALDKVWQTLLPDQDPLILDIDCIPLDRRVLEVARNALRLGILFGAYGRAMHIDETAWFIHPCFMACSKRAWEVLDKPSFCSRPGRWDTGGEFSRNAGIYHMSQRFLRPVKCDREAPWTRGGYKLGYGNTLGTKELGQIYHMAGARDNHQGDIVRFIAKCDEVVAGAAK